MQHVSNDENKGMSEIILLPIADLHPSDNNCIYSTLHYVASQAMLLNVVTPCITFDQAMWQKAVEICGGSGLDVFWTRKGSLIATTVVLVVLVLVVTVFEKCLRLC